MATLLYPIIAEWDDTARAWSLLSPDFPEIASAAQPGDDIGQQALDALWTAVDARREDDEVLPTPAHEPWLLTKDWQPADRNMLLFVSIPAEPPLAEPVSVNVSLDKHLLERVDLEAVRRGATRSELLAEAAWALLRR